MATSPPPQEKGKGRAYAMVAAAAAVVLGAFVMFQPEAPGGVVISVAGPGGTVVDGVSIFIDGEEVCADSTCKVQDLEPGSYIVKAKADGYAEMAGKAHVVVSGEQNALNIELVKDHQKEALPTAKKEAEPKEQAAADVPKPAETEETAKAQPNERAEPAPAAPPQVSSKGTQAKPVTPAPRVANPTPKPSGTTGKLNINSIPVSTVLVDGRPMGSTPKMGVSLPAGSHTVVFIHPQHGRKVRTVTVKNGSTSTAAVRFP